METVDFLGEEEHWRRIAVKLAQMDPDAFETLGATLASHEPMLDALGAIQCPTTVLVGSKDDPFVVPSKRMAERIPEAALVTIPLAAHCPQYENADAWRDAIREHLAKGAP